MADCSEYLELISRSVDGDLSAEEAETLYEHLAHCPTCSETLSSFEELSMMTADTLKTPPSQLKDGVMTSLRATKNRPWYVKYRFTAVAACFALVVLAISYTPLGDFLAPPRENEILTEDTAAPVRGEDVSFGASYGTDTASEEESVLRTAEAPPEAVADNSAAVEAKTAPQAENPEPMTEEAAENTPMEDAAADTETDNAAVQDSEEILPLVLPLTPYEETFAKYLLFSAPEAPEVLYDITSDQTLDHVVYYIVTAEQFTAVQSALLEDGIEVQVISGDPKSEQFLLILTITQ